MGNVEVDKCDFCNCIKSVQRTYFYPSNYKKPKELIESNKLYNEGDYFLFLKTCIDCGIPNKLRNGN